MILKFYRLFQSAPPHGGRRAYNDGPGWRRDGCFNPRPRTGGDTNVRLFAPRLPCTTFQSAPPHGGRRECCSLSRPSIYGFTFQSAPPHGGRPAICAGSRWTLTSFNPRPRTGGDMHGCDCAGWPLTCDTRFNPRPRTGGDTPAFHSDAACTYLYWFQSAPPHGGRPAGSVKRIDDHAFQSAPPHGGRPAADVDGRSAQVTLFQSAPPHGGRRSPPILSGVDRP